MKAKRYPARNNWRVLIPARFTDNGKQRARFFDTKTEAETEIRRILNRGNSSKPHVSEADEAAFTLAKDEGLSPHEYLEAIRLYKKTVGGIASEKRVDLQTACEAFIERQKRENRNRRTIYSDSQSLKYLCQFAGWKLPLVELTDTRINEYFDTMKPGGRRRTQHGRIKKFLNWCTETGYLVLNPMAKIKPREKWNSNREILDIEAFRRILFVAAGLEPFKPGEIPTLLSTVLELEVSVEIVIGVHGAPGHTALERHDGIDHPAFQHRRRSLQLLLHRSQSHRPVVDLFH